MPPVADTQLAEQYGVPVSLITSHREQVLKEGLSAIAELVAGLTPEKRRGAPAVAPVAVPSPLPPPDAPEPVAPSERRKAMARGFVTHHPVLGEVPHPYRALRQHLRLHCNFSETAPQSPWPSGVHFNCRQGQL
jgi:hypothetical protein